MCACVCVCVRVTFSFRLPEPIGADDNIKLTQANKILATILTFIPGGGPLARGFHPLSSRLEKKQNKKKQTQTKKTSGSFLFRVSVQHLTGIDRSNDQALVPFFLNVPLSATHTHTHRNKRKWIYLKGHEPVASWSGITSLPPTCKLWN